MAIDLGTPDAILEQDDAVATLRFNRPDTLNAFNDGLRQGVARAIDWVRREPSVRALVVTGEGRGFCSGLDLTAPRTEPGRHGEPVALASTGGPALGLLRLEKPVIGAINGVAVGMGFSVALACDIRIAAESARFSAMFIRRGLGPDNALSFLLPRLTGTARACELMFTGDMVGARDAEAYGIVNRVVPDGRLLDEALELARRIAAGPPLALQLTKQAIYRGILSDAEEQARLESMHAHILTRTDDYQEGIAAFREGREPRFTGT